MKDFFEQQAEARIRTNRLIWLFVFSVATTVLFLYLSVSMLWYLLVAWQEFKGSAWARGGVESFMLWDAERFFLVSIGALSIIGGGALYKMQQLKSGGRAVALMLGGRSVSPNSTDLKERQLLNIVEEIAIASGVPVPDVYLLDRETGINAFAAGFGRNDAIVCVTRGTLDYLNRDELQGVVAHEFSHIRNDDIGINIKLMGILHGLLVISIIGVNLMRPAHHIRARNSWFPMLSGLVLYIVGYAGLFFGNVIKSAVSRQREYLADASAVQFTRNPLGIAGALKKIGGMTMGSVLISPHTSEASHMFISNALNMSMLDFMNTHPPLIERIRRLEPDFDGQFERVKAIVNGPAMPSPTAFTEAAEKKRMEVFGGAITGAMAASMLNSVGQAMREHMDEAGAIVDELPDQLLRAVHEPDGACAVIYILLLDREKGIRDVQRQYLLENESKPVIARIRKLVPYRKAIRERGRLPLVDMAMPSLRMMSKAQYEAFKGHVERMITADQQVSPFEFMLRHIMLKRLDAHFYNIKPRAAQIYSIAGVAGECAIVLSELDRAGGGGAFERAAALISDDRVRLSYVENAGMDAMDKALDRLESASPVIKKILLAACLECLTHDGVITPAEAEMFRAVSEALGVPAPPWLTTQITTSETVH